MSEVNLSAASFAGAIRAKAAELGRAVGKEAVAEIEEACRSLASVDPTTSAVTIDLGKGAIPLDTHLAHEVRRLSTASAPASTTGRPAWGPNDGVLSMGRGWAEIQRAKLASEVATWINPWLKGPSFNRTRQSVIQDSNAALAAEMKMKAGVA